MSASRHELWDRASARASAIAAVDPGNPQDPSERQLNVTFATANTALANLLAAGFISEITGKARNRIYRFNAYLRLFEEESAAMPAIYQVARADDYMHGGADGEEAP